MIFSIPCALKADKYCFPTICNNLISKAADGNDCLQSAISSSLIYNIGHQKKSNYYCSYPWDRAYGYLAYFVISEIYISIGPLVRSEWTETYKFLSTHIKFTGSRRDQLYAVVNYKPRKYFLLKTSWLLNPVKTFKSFLQESIFIVLLLLWLVLREWCTGKLSLLLVFYIPESSTWKEIKDIFPLLEWMFTEATEVKYKICII